MRSIDISPAFFFLFSFGVSFWSARQTMRVEVEVGPFFYVTSDHSFLRFFFMVGA